MCINGHKIDKIFSGNDMTLIPNDKHTYKLQTFDFCSKWILLLSVTMKNVLSNEIITTLY
jgi:hypothetical protein